MTEVDIGYDPASTTWRYLDPFSRRPVVVSFEKEVALIGDRAIALLNAAKRGSIGRPSTTIHNKIMALRKCVRAIHKYGRKSNKPEEWADFLETALLKSNLAEYSRWATYNAAAGLLREVARVRHEEFRRRNPFTRRQPRRETILYGDDLVPLLAQARKDAVSILKAFRNPKAEHVAFIDEARALCNDGFFVPGDVAQDTPAVRLARRWTYDTGLKLADLTLHLYPSPIHLIPFFVLLTHALAGNVESVALMRRDGPRPFLHPSYGPCFELTLEKPRAGSIAPYLVRDAGTLSVGWLIRGVLELTASLVDGAAENNTNLAFLARTNQKNIVALTGNSRTQAMQQYLRRHGLPHTTLKSLRSARGIEEYNRTGDAFRVQRLLNQADFAQTIAYLNRVETSEHDDRVLADVQRTMSRPRSSVHLQHSSTSAAGLASHTCLHPQEPSKDHDANGFCAHLLWPFNDVHFIFMFEPRPVAFLLRDYAALCEAESVMASARFQKRYAPLKRRIESEYLPLIDDELRRLAESIIPTLPSFPRIESL